MDNPDREIENFWLTFKCCLKNFYKHCDVEINLEEISDKLNKMQRNRDYVAIEYTIQKKMCDLIIIVFKNIERLRIDHTFIYYLRIIITNLKRWCKIRDKKLFLKDPIEFESDYFLLLKLLSSQVKNLENKEKVDDLIIFFDICYKGIKDHDYSFMIDYAIERRESKMLEIINNIVEVIPYINREYNMNIFNGTSFKKVVNNKKLQLVFSSKK